MEIREATNNDIPAIVGLLRLSLGESLMPKSEAFWRWKHIENPFGPSPVLVAEEKGELIGVRAFMRWEWQCQGRVYRAVRAVDTATHPAHQGRGIFKSLTLQLLAQCRQEGIDFVFNTPNKKSKPGYMKMGWEEVGRLPISIRMHCSAARGRDDAPEAWHRLEGEWSAIPSSPDRLVTHFSPRYWRWRYQHNPNVRYHIVGAADAEPCWLIYRTKPRRGFTEVRVVDYLGTTAGFSRALAALRLRQPGFGLLAASGLNACLPGGVRLPVGPEVTVRLLTDSVPVRTFEQWSPSLGDLELF